MCVRVGRGGEHRNGETVLMLCSPQLREGGGFGARWEQKGSTWLSTKAFSACSSSSQLLLVPHVCFLLGPHRAVLSLHALSQCTHQSAGQQLCFCSPPHTHTFLGVLCSPCACSG